MTLTRGFTDDIKMISSDANLGAFQNEFLSETITRIGQNTSSPLNLSASFPLADSLLNISSSLVTAGDGGSKSVPPINSIVPSVTAHTTIDFQTGIVTGQTITVNGGAFTLPVGTIGEYTRYALVLRSDGTIDSIFSTQSVTIVGLTNAGTLLATLLNTAGLPIGWIDLLCDGVGTYRTAGSIISIIENSGIYRFGISGGGDLQAKLNAEITARNNADSTLQANINTEATSRANADSTLQSNLNTETTARANADSTLQANLNTETTARMNAVSTLQMNINTEITARANADSTLQSNLNVETTARMNTDSTLQTNLNTETTARANADSTLQSNLNVETTARMNTDSTLQTNLNTEATSRANADTTLQTNINTISNVGITAGNGIATSGTIGGNNLNVAVGPLASNWDTTGAYISVKTPASPANAVTKAYVDQLAITGGTIKEALLSDHQLKSGAVVAGILAAEVVYFNIIPIINDTIVITNGITTETYTFVASRSIAFQVTIAAGDPVTTMNNLWSAINTDSAAWISDWAVAGLDAINTIGVVIVIEANAASGVSPSRIYGTWATQANCNVVTYNTAPEYRTSQASSTLPTTDPAAGRFGIRKAIADLVDGEIHDCLETDTLRSWHPDTWAWLTLSGSGSLPNATAASGGGILGKVTFDSDLGLDVNSGVAQVKIDNSTIKFNISGQLIADQGNFNAEVTARMNADSTLQANINAEATSRANGDSTLQANINTEATTRTNADSTLQNNLNVETTARMNADSTLQTNLNTEVTARSNADSTLQANINTEATARTNADNAETTARTNADTTLQANINTEATTRANADSTLQTNINTEITARNNADDAEITARSNADTTLQNNINAEITTRNTEATTRFNADTTLQNNINTEITARSAAILGSEAATLTSNTLTPATNQPIQRITSGSSPLNMIANPVSGQLKVIINETGSNLTVNNATGGTAANQIYTGTGAALTVQNNAALTLVYDGGLSKWVVTGGAGGMPVLAVTGASINGTTLSAGIHYVVDMSSGTSVSVTAPKGASGADFRIFAVGNLYNVNSPLLTVNANATGGQDYIYANGIATNTTYIISNLESYVEFVWDNTGSAIGNVWVVEKPGAGSGSVQGPGTVPLGAIMPVVNASPITGGGYTIPPSGTVDTNGWQLCDGSAIPGGNILTGSTPNLSDGRYLRGSTVSGTVGGSNTFTPAGTNTASNVPALGLSFSGSSTSYTVSVPAHYHGIGTGAALSAAGQTLGSSAIALASGSAAGQTFSGSSGTMSANTTHSHTVDGGIVGVNMGSGSWSGYSVVTAAGVHVLTVGEAGLTGTNAPNIDHSHTINHIHAPSGVTGTTDIAHTHAPSVVTGTIGLFTGGSNGNSPFSASGNNTPSGSITGTATAAAQAFTGTAANNEPQYLNVRYLIRVK